MVEGKTFIEYVQDEVNCKRCYYDKDLHKRVTKQPKPIKGYWLQGVYYKVED